MAVEPQWWGYSKDHGWVVLDRELPCNAPGLNPDLLFFRCRDGKTFVLKRELWRSPAYQFAPNYLRELAGAAADEARAEFEEMQRQWPEFQAELKREYQATVSAAEEAKPRAKKPRAKAASQSAKAAQSDTASDGSESEEG